VLLVSVHNAFHIQFICLQFQQTVLLIAAYGIQINLCMFINPKCWNDLKACRGCIF